MTFSVKYGRTYHYPFSPGTTSDDRINPDFGTDLAAISELIHTEKLDGENNCLNRHGVFARSHAAPTQSPWTRFLWRRWELIRHELGELELFGENVFAVHSIAYERLESHFYVFAIREGDRWLSWDETTFYAALLDFPTVPELARQTAPLTAGAVEKTVRGLVGQPSRFGSVDALTHQPCTMEGVVSRDAGSYRTDEFARRVFKYVRPGHVKTDEHWTRTWKRAPLKQENNRLCTGN